MFRSTESPHAGALGGVSPFFASASHKRRIGRLGERACTCAAGALDAGKSRKVRRAVDTTSRRLSSTRPSCATRTYVLGRLHFLADLRGVGLRILSSCRAIFVHCISPYLPAVTPFQIRPFRNSALYADVHIHVGSRAFYRATGVGGVVGLVRTRELFSARTRRRMADRRFADVHLRAEFLQPGVVSHELFHLTIAYARRRGWLEHVRPRLIDAQSLPPLPRNGKRRVVHVPVELDPYEERMAFIHGHFMHQVFNAISRRGLE